MPDDEPPAPPPMGAPPPWGRPFVPDDDPEPDDDGGFFVGDSHSVREASWRGEIATSTEAIAMSVPNEAFPIDPANRVATTRAGETFESANARSSIPAPHVNAAGSIAPLPGVHGSPPATFATAPATHARRTTPSEFDAPSVDVSHSGRGPPLAAPKYAA